MRYANKTFCLCRVSLSKDACWFHTIPPIGEYPGGSITHLGKPVQDAILVVDRTAYDRIQQAFAAEQAKTNWRGLLVDREHFSLDAEKSSDAMAWAKDMREYADGLWTQWDFTPPGRDAWENQVLVSRSPVMELEHLGGKRFRPIRLESIGMTNTPHFDLSTLAAARAAENQEPNPEPTQGDSTMQKLLTMLGLPETATEDEAAAALQTILDREAAAAQAQATAEEDAEEAKAACRKIRCDAFLIAHKDQISDLAKFREVYEANPDAVEATFGLFRAPATATRISARDAATPADGTAVTLAAYRAMPAGKQKDTFLAAHKDTLLRLERAESK